LEHQVIRHGTGRQEQEGIRQERNSPVRLPGRSRQQGQDSRLCCMARMTQTAVGSSVNAQTGVSIAVYKPQDYDESNPVYHVKTWDADGNMTERMVNISEIDPRHCDEIEMSAYTWYLSNSGKCPNAFMNFAGAKAYNQANPFEKTDWVSIIKDYMQMQYDAGNMKGYLDYKKLLGFITCH
jgi:hypothetical protein